MKSSKQHLFEIDFFGNKANIFIFFFTDQFNVSSMVAKFQELSRLETFHGSQWEYVEINGN